MNKKDRQRFKKRHGVSERSWKLITEAIKTRQCVARKSGHLQKQRGDTSLWNFVPNSGLKRFHHEKKRSVIDSARIVCVAGSTQLSSVRPSVCLSVPSDHRTPLLQVCCCGPGGHEISIDCWSSVGRVRAAPRCQRTKNNHSNQTNRSKIRNKSLVVNAVATICMNQTGLLVNN